MDGFTFIMPILRLRMQKVPRSHLDSIFCLGPPTKLTLGFEG